MNLGTRPQYRGRRGFRNGGRGWGCVMFMSYLYLSGLIYGLISGLLYESTSGLAWDPIMHIISPFPYLLPFPNAFGMCMVHGTLLIEGSTSTSTLDSCMVQETSMVDGEVRTKPTHVRMQGRPESEIKM